MRLVFTGIVTDLRTFYTRVAEVEAGSRPAEELRADLQTSLRRAEGTRDLLGSSAGLPGNPIPKDLYLRSALLYAEALRALEAALGTQGALRSELVRQARRLKLLSDRVYDRGTAAADPELASGGPDVDLRLPEEVPDWEAEGLAAAPPLAPAPPGPPPEEPPIRQDRPSQPFPAWMEDITPIVDTVQAQAGRFPVLSRSPSLRTARRAAAEIMAAAEAARAVPDPEGMREPAALLRLAMLVDAEAAYAFAAASAAPPPSRGAAGAHARNLALLGEDLWGLALERLEFPEGLPPHPRSDFDRTALEPRPATGLGGGGR
jgi:hypothetical protein